MNKIKSLVEFVQKFDYVIKIAKAVLAGFDKFTEELNKEINPVKNESK